MGCSWEEMRKKIEAVTCDAKVSKIMGLTNRKRKTLCVETDEGEDKREEMEKRDTISSSKYGFVSYYGEEVRKIKANNSSACITKEVRKKIGSAFKNLPLEEKCKYVCRSQKEGMLNAEKQNFVSRCAPDRFTSVASKLTTEQRIGVCSIGFGKLIEMKCGRLQRKLCEGLVKRVDIARSILTVHGKELELSPLSFGYIMGIADGGLDVEADGDMQEVDGYLKRFEATSRGIHIKTLADILHKSTRGDDEFKVTFTLFALCSLLCPSSAVHISSSLLISVMNVETISARNWASFCFGRLMEGIKRYKQEKMAYIGGCLLYLQILYINSVANWNLGRDPSLCPLVRWDGIEIIKFMKWIRKQGGIGAEKVPLYDKQIIKYCAIGGCKKHLEKGGKNKLLNVERRQYLNYTEGGSKDHRMSSKLPNLTHMTIDLVRNLEIVRGVLGEHGGMESENEEVNKIVESNGLKVEQLPLNIDNWGGGGKSQMVRDENAAEEILPVKENNENVMCYLGLQLQASFEGNPQRCHCNCVNKDMMSNNNTAVLSSVNSPSQEVVESSVGMPNREEIEQTMRCSHFGRFRVGPYVLTFPATEDEWKLITYIMNEDLDGSEIIVQTKMNWLNRRDLLSLCPERWIHGEIISLVAETLSNNEREKASDSPYTWFLPTYFAQMILIQGSDIAWLGRWKHLRKCYMQDLTQCEKIVIPINHNACHWYVLIVDIPTTCAEIWDSLPSASTKNAIVGEVNKILRALDEILKDDIRMLYGSDFMFQSFCSFHKQGLSKQCNRYDCGLFVIRWMENLGITEVPNYMYKSEDERKKLAIQLVMSGSNVLKEKMILRAQSFYMTNEADKRNIARYYQMKYRAQAKHCMRKGHGRRL